MEVAPSLFQMQRIAEREKEWQGKQAVFELPEVIRLFDQTINILEHGLRPTENANHAEHDEPKEKGKLFVNPIDNNQHVEG